MPSIRLKILICVRRKEDRAKKPAATEEDRAREVAMDEFERDANDWFYKQD